MYLVCLRFCGCVILSASIVGVQGMLAYGSYRLLAASTDVTLYADDPAMKNTTQVAAVAMTCGAILFFLLAIFMIRRLVLAGAFLNHASKALAQLKKLLVVPFLSYALLLLLAVWGILVTVCLFRAGDTTTRVATIATLSPSSTVDVRTASFHVNTTLRWLFLYHLWGMYWSTTFVLAIGETITATAVSVWYFSDENRVTSRKVLQDGDPVAHAIKATFRYHLGTIALSAASVTVVRYVRAFFLYLEDKNEFDGNQVTTFLAKCCCVSGERPFRFCVCWLIFELRVWWNVVVWTVLQAVL